MLSTYPFHPCRFSSTHFSSVHPQSAPSPLLYGGTENFGHRADQIFSEKGLVDQWKLRVANGEDFMRVRRHEQNGHARPYLSDLLNHHNAVHHWHDHIRQYQIDCIRLDKERL